MQVSGPQRLLCHPTARVTSEPRMRTAGVASGRFAQQQSKQAKLDLLYRRLNRYVNDPTRWLPKPPIYTGTAPVSEVRANEYTTLPWDMPVLGSNGITHCLLGIISPGQKKHFITHVTDNTAVSSLLQSLENIDLSDSVIVLRSAVNLRNPQDPLFAVSQSWNENTEISSHSIALEKVMGVLSQLGVQDRIRFISGPQPASLLLHQGNIYLPGDVVSLADSAEEFSAHATDASDYPEYTFTRPWLEELDIPEDTLLTRAREAWGRVRRTLKRTT